MLVIYLSEVEKSCYKGILYCVFSRSVHSNTGRGCASVLNTHLSRGITSSSKKSKYRYFSLEGLSASMDNLFDMVTHVSARK